MAVAHPELKRVTGSKIIGEAGSADVVLQLTTPDGEVQYTMSRADLVEESGDDGRQVQPGEVSPAALSVACG